MTRSEYSFMASKEVIIFTTVAVAILLPSPAIAAHKTKSPAAPAARSHPPSIVHHVDLADLLEVAGPFQTFLGYLRETNVIQTFQNQANSKVSITIFVPRDSAFVSLKKTTLVSLTKAQLKSLLLYHAFSKYYSMHELAEGRRNPVATLAGSQYTLNLTEHLGSIGVKSMWSNAKIVSVVYSRAPVSVYEVDKVLLQMQIFKSL